jgi:hypothetical protein
VVSAVPAKPEFDAAMLISIKNNRLSGQSALRISEIALFDYPPESNRSLIG